MKLIRELCESVDISFEEKENKKDYYIQGITLQANIKNKNGRVYPLPILEQAIDVHKRNFMDTPRGALGELNHPNDNITEIDYDRASHKFVSVVREGNNFVTKAKVLDTPKGKILKTLIDEGITPGISSRALGELSESNGVKVVKKLHIISLGDIVSNPSAPDAFVQGVLEKKEWIWEQGELVEKDIEEDMDEWKKALEKAPKSLVKEVAVEVFQDFLNKLVNK